MNNARPQPSSPDSASSPPCARRDPDVRTPLKGAETRWCAAGMVEASSQFRRVNGHLHLPSLRTTLERQVAAAAVRTDCNTQDVSVSLMLTGPPPKFHGTRDILLTGITPNAIELHPVIRFR